MARIRSRRKRKRIAIEKNKRLLLNDFIYKSFNIFGEQIKCYENKFNTNN